MKTLQNKKITKELWREKVSGYQNRSEAGHLLGEQLQERYYDRHPIVMALPRGGVVIGYEVARILHAQLDVVVARKLGAPEQPELGIGAVAPDGIIVFNEIARQLRIPEEEAESIARRERAEVDRQLHMYRGDKPMPDLRDRTIILVDDGLATGITAMAAIEYARRQSPRQITFAVPVGAPVTIRDLLPLVDDLVCPLTPSSLGAVALWYADFRQITDDDVIHLLRQADKERLGNHATPPGKG